MLLALVPKLSVEIPVVLGGPLDSPGTLQVLALCLLFAGIALTYDVLFGFTGLLSFGHALYVALGVYMTAIALTRWEWGLWPTLGFLVVVGLAVPLVLGAVSLRVGGIAFAMVTLAFAQAGNVLVQKNPYGWTGGEEGTGLNYDEIPDAFVGVLNTKNLYWLALGYAVLVFVVVRLAVNSSAGHVWRAIRENEPRVEVIGLCAIPVQADRVRARARSSPMLGGVVWLLLIGGATPEVTTANFTLALLVMVVLGGAGTRYGAMIGGFLYTLADQRLGSLAGSEHRAGSPRRAPDPALRAALPARHALHPARVLRPGRAREPARAPPRAPLAARAAPREGGRVTACRSPGNGTAPGQPLLLIHGLGYARWGWEPVLPGLAEQFDVILFDNRGIGESDAPAGPYTVAEMAGDAVRVLDEAGVERAHVVGTSLGGMIAQELALSHPERVDRLVLACTTPGGPQRASDAAGDRRADGGGGDARARGGAAAVRRERALAGDGRERARRSSSGSSRTGSRRRRRLPPGRRRPPRERRSTRTTGSASLAAPTLVQHGSEDVVVDPRNADAPHAAPARTRARAPSPGRDTCSSGRSRRASSRRSRRSSRGAL